MKSITVGAPLNHAKYEVRCAEPKQKISVAIIRQGLSAVYDWIMRLKEVGTASCNNGSVVFRLVTANGTCHKAYGRNCMCY